MLIVTGQKFNILVHFVFCALDIGWFYLLAFIALPQLEKFKFTLVLKALPLMLLTICYGLLVFYTVRGLNFIYFGKSELALQTQELFKYVWRGVYIWLLAMCFWYARGKLRAMEESRDKVERLLVSEKMRLELEAAYLRSHINPHLLFNSLTFLYNNMLEHSPAASEPVMIMADMMRYALNTGHSGSMVTIKEEAEHINRLITLYQLPEKRNRYVYFFCRIQNEDTIVPSMLFNHFAENVLMHGLLTDPGNPAIIELSEKRGIINLKTRNKAFRQKKTHGSGLDNTRKRLEHYYPGRYELHIKERNDEFFIDLRLTA